ncbi:HofP DNA utilization family protein [Enterobacter sp. CC120223-11]|uniref:HofP DNA utilization family protein n=1 Tax=Enterobacter sp. CC120223-11 TaxID=1378073 RepID=UPI000BE2F159|nr:HofP DNA utilization family protein [Enterobacter sp. CC120223-11]
MMTDWRLYLGLLFPLLLGMRNPFLPPEDRCFGAQITLWQYRGMVSHGDERTGIVRDAKGKWRRLSQGLTLDNGWTVAGIAPDHIEMTAGSDCEPSQWHWLRKGTQHDAKDDAGASANGLRRTGQRETRHPDGG